MAIDTTKTSNGQHQCNSLNENYNLGPGGKGGYYEVFPIHRETKVPDYKFATSRRTVEKMKKRKI